MNRNQIGQRILLARRDLDMTQFALGVRASLSAQYISDLERGKSVNPSIRDILALSDALGVSPAYLLGWTDDPLASINLDHNLGVTDDRVYYQVDNPDQTRLFQQLLDVFSDLSIENQQIALEIINTIRRSQNVKVVE